MKSVLGAFFRVPAASFLPLLGSDTVGDLSGVMGFLPLFLDCAP